MSFPHSMPRAGRLRRLESDIAVLEQHLETMRATYQLNAEKLEYNYRVLLERDAGAQPAVPLQPAVFCLTHLSRSPTDSQCASCLL
jgi:hypothetical protein